MKNIALFGSLVLIVIGIYYNVRSSKAEESTVATASDDTITFGYSEGVQTYVIPKTGDYTLRAVGSKGEDYDSHTGGYGGLIEGNFVLEEGRVLKVVTGGIGTNYAGTGSSGGSGGGRTEIWIDNILLLVAGGGRRCK